MGNRSFVAWLAAMLFTIPLFSQNGTLAGKVIENETGFEVIGATVMVRETGSGAASDLDGSYQISLPAGQYTVEVSYVGFAMQVFDNVVVETGKVTNLDISLSEEAQQLDLGAVVTAKAKRNTVMALLALQQKSPVVLDGISSAQISQTGDGDAAAAVRRVTGVTIEGGKYVYVRGLGDRYSKTTLNGAEVPGLDPNRNTVQMDLFPSNLLDNIVVYKTFSPNLPGDFSGGYVDIATKDFPAVRTIQFSASSGFRTGTTFNGRFLTYPGGSTDWLGMDDGTRAVPRAVQNLQGAFPEYSQGLNNAAVASQLEDLTRSFNNSWRFSNQRPPVNHSIGLSFGNQKTLFGKPLGYITSLTYQRSFTHYEDGKYGIYELTGKAAQTTELNSQLELSDNKSTEEVLWGALFSVNLKLAPMHRIGFMAMHNQSSDKSSRYLEGRKYRDDGEDIFQTRTWDWQERGMTTGQFNGKHVFGNAGSLEMAWISSYSRSSQDNPDLRFFTNRYIPEDDRYRLKPSSDNPPTRFYRDLEQTSFDNKVDFTLPFQQWNGLGAELKFGASYVMRERSFRETRYNFNNQSLSLPDGDVFAYFSEDNLIKAGDKGFDGTAGVYVTNNYDPKNNYDADQQVAAAYLMTDLPITRKLRALAGVRVERTAVQLLTFDTSITLLKFPQLNGQDDLLSNTDFLPSVNLNYALNEVSKLRLAYSRTLARPTFRELAPFASFAVDGGFVFVGNPDLTRTLIDNVDLRWEAFSGTGEMVSVSAFYKHFTNPIERAFNPKAQNTELSLRNVDAAFLAGSEIEIRKSLESLSPSLAPFMLAANFAYIYSETTIDEAEMALILEDDPNASRKRAMYGQAPYTANAVFTYQNKGLQANVAFNVTGARIITVTKGATPNYYLQPQPSLNFNLSKEWESGLGLRFSAGNLLDSAYEERATYQGQHYTVASYRTGRTFSVGVSFKIPPGS